MDQFEPVAGKVGIIQKVGGVVGANSGDDIAGEGKESVIQTDDTAGTAELREPLVKLLSEVMEHGLHLGDTKAGEKGLERLSPPAVEIMRSSEEVRVCSISRAGKIQFKSWSYLRNLTP